MQNIPILTLSIAAAADLVEHRAVGHDGNYATTAEEALGFTVTDVDSGDMVALTVLGTAIAEAGGAFSVGDPLKVGTSGKLVDQAGTGTIVARALEAASADGDKVEVLPIVA